MAIIDRQSDGLWYAQEQGVIGRRTIGGFASKEAAVRMAAKEFGEDVRLEITEPRAEG
jgi:hypothetical protein